MSVILSFLFETMWKGSPGIVGLLALCNLLGSSGETSIAFPVNIHAKTLQVIRGSLHRVYTSDLQVQLTNLNRETSNSSCLVN